MTLKTVGHVFSVWAFRFSVNKVRHLTDINIVWEHFWGLFSRCVCGLVFMVFEM